MKLMHISYWVAAALFAATGLCSAAEAPSPPGGPSLTEENITLFFRQVVILFVVYRIVRFLFKKVPVEEFVFEIGVGVILGPTILGRFAPEIHDWVFPDDKAQTAILAFVGILGIVFWLFEGGSHVKPREAVKHGKAAVLLGLGGVLLPLAAGYPLSLWFCKLFGISAPGGQSIHLVALFLANTMAISAMVIVVRLLTALKIIRSEIGQIILCGYAINDIVAWMIYGAIFQFSSGHGQGILQTIVMLLLGVVLTGFCLRFAPDIVNRELEKMALSKGKGSVYVFVVSLILGLGLLTELLGLTRYFGVFLAGVVVSTSDVVTHDVKERLTTFGRLVLAPLFFMVLGMSCDFTRHFSLATAVFITVGSMTLKYSGAYACAALAGRPKKEWHLIGVAFIPGDVNAIILGGIALSYGLITHDILSAIVISAVVSSIVAGPALRTVVKRMNEKQPVRTLLECIPVLMRDIRRCDAPNRAVALEKQIVPHVASNINMLASDVATAIEKARAKYGMEVRDVESGMTFPPGIAHIHITLPIEQETLFCFWSGTGIEWGPEKVRFVMVSIQTEDRSASDFTDRVYSLQSTIGELGLVNLDHTPESAQKFRQELMTLLKA